MSSALLSDRSPNVQSSWPIEIELPSKPPSMNSFPEAS